MSTPVNSDKFLVNRGGSSYYVTHQNIMAELLDTDLLLVNRGSASYKITGEDFKDSVGPSAVAPYIAAAVLADDSPGGARFTSKSFTTTLTMGPEGTPISTKFLKPYVIGAITAIGQTSAITSVAPGGWTAASAAASNGWRSVTYGNGKFVATSETGTNQVMYSTDGINWNSASPATNKYWNTVTYGNGKFVSVAQNSPASTQVMYSSNGINWNSASATEGNTWRSVTYGGNKFVAVSSDGTNQVMYSTNGTSWSSASATEFNLWYSVTYGNGKFVAVSGNGTNRVMYSTDGINWSSASAPETNDWRSVTYGNGKFVALSMTGTNRVMYSTDGINWNSASAAEANTWRSVTYGGDKFVAVSSDGTNRVMYSTDGITWSSASSAELNTWFSVAYGGNKFVAVSDTGTNQVMWSGSGTSDTGLTLTNDDDFGYFQVGDVVTGPSTPVGDGVAITAMDASVPSMDVDGGTWAVGDVVTNTVERQETNIPTTDTITTSTTVSISSGYEAVTYTGNGTAQTISGMNITPSLVWTKRRSTASNHVLMDVVRGPSKGLYSNLTSAEQTDDSLDAFYSDGFQVTGNGDTNKTGETYVSWCFDGGDWAPATVPSDWNNSQAWSSNAASTNGTTYGDPEPGTPASMFDGKLNTYFGPTATPSSPSPATVDVNFSPALSGELTLFAAMNQQDDATSGVNVTHAGGTTFVNNTTLGLTSSAASATVGTFTGITKITFQYVYGGSGAGSGFYIKQVSIDDDILVDKGTIPVDSLGNSLPSVQSRVKANPDAGFSCVSYIGTGSNATVATGLNSPADLIIVKDLTSTNAWSVYHTSIGTSTDNYIELQSAAAASPDNTAFQGTAPTSSVFYIGTKPPVSQSGDSFIAYCWAEKPGISKISSYIGNGAANGPTVACGFEPAFLLVKCSTQGYWWNIVDSTRNPSNPVTDRLYPNEQSNEQSNIDVCDFLSNGFQITTTSYAFNQSGETYIFMAIGDSLDVTQLGFASGEDLNRFSAGDNAYYGNQPAGVTGTVKNVVDSGNTHTMQISPANTSWATGGFVTGDASPDPDAKMYCQTTSSGQITGLVSADPGYTQMASTLTTQTVTFPALFQTGDTPDTELPAGTSLACDVTAANSEGSSSRTTNTVTPT